MACRCHSAAVRDVRLPPRVAPMLTKARYFCTSSTARTAASGRACSNEEQTGSDGARAGGILLGARTGAGAVTLPKTIRNGT